MCSDAGNTSPLAEELRSQECSSFGRLKLKEWIDGYWSYIARKKDLAVGRSLYQLKYLSERCSKETPERLFWPAETSFLVPHTSFLPGYSSCLSLLN